MLIYFVDYTYRLRKVSTPSLIPFSWSISIRSPRLWSFSILSYFRSFSSYVFSICCRDGLPIFSRNCCAALFALRDLRGMVGILAVDLLWDRQMLGEHSLSFITDWPLQKCRLKSSRFKSLPGERELLFFFIFRASSSNCILLLREFPNDLSWPKSTFYILGCSVIWENYMRLLFSCVDGKTFNDLLF